VGAVGGAAAGVVYVAATAGLRLLEVNATVQAVAFVEVQPVQFENVLPPALAGAVKVTELPIRYLRVKPATPLPAPLMSFRLTAMVTPLVGLIVLTEICEKKIPPPHPVRAAFRARIVPAMRYRT
jgi:hypothetical protein